MEQEPRRDAKLWWAGIAADRVGAVSESAQIVIYEDLTDDDVETVTWV